ncbi:HupE/UreJ family protein [Methylomonas fluvii]|uniref:HupE/UreJ family protein n=1 Tax=Methylomonas fluvii TaxID=1854564 RepID=A0ABR9DN79_9GAMM|nr:HupE/UreJ family protein [Methylomonas fluvii]MBD9363729.1 HupE/UreJ family protein [Methylomonas fluvii]
MKSSPTSKFADAGRSPGKLLLSFGLPFLLLLAFLSTQFIDFDDIGWSNGFNHPLIGLDHLVTMLAVGIWAAQLRGQAIWMLPLAFVGVMSLGGLAGAAGIALPSVEGIILLSCAVFSVLITRKVRFSAKVNVLIVAFFAFFHGYAHGQEISTSASLISYTLGFMLATLLLHGAGILVAKLVVFCVTCLLTAMFANAALAKSADADREDHLNAPAKLLVHHAGLPQTTSTWWAMQAAGGDYARSLALQLELIADLQACRDMASVAVTHGAVGKLKLSFNKPQGGSGAQDYRLLVDTQPSQLVAICPDRALFDADHLVNAGLDFKHYYRDVNHTPGKHLLSNGVGLTSPPVSKVLASSQAFQNSCTTSNSFIEEFALQAKFARPYSGNLPTQTTIHFRPDGAVGNQDPSRHSASARLVCPTNFLSSLTAEAKSLGGIVSIHLLWVSQLRLPFAMSVKPLDRAIPYPNITIKTNKVFNL